MPRRRTDATLEKYVVTRARQQLAMQKGLGTLDQLTRTLIGDACSRPTEGSRQVLFLAISYLSEIATTSVDDEGMQEVVAKALRQAGFARLYLGSAQGRDDYRRAIHVYETLAARFADRIWYRTGLIETLKEFASILREAGDTTEADAFFRRAVRVAESLLDNNDADRHCFSMGLVGPFNEIAWELVRRPHAPTGDVGLAVRLARKAVVWAPGQSGCLSTLGVALYRTGDLSSASKALKQSIELSKGGTAVDWFLLASISHQHGKIDESRRCYDRAVAWMRLNPAVDRAQAADLLRVSGRIYSGDRLACNSS